jgi:hypothetical protein
MAAASYADPRALLATAAPQIWETVPRRSLFGDAVLVIFLLAQGLDGVFTYVGVVTFGAGIEANPLISWLMLHLGHAVALMSAKALASLLGIALHLCRNHAAVALLALFYLTVAVVPWIVILFF